MTPADMLPPVLDPIGDRIDHAGALAQAEEQLRINTDSHARGLSTLSDLLDAQAALQHARDRHIEARARCRTPPTCSARDDDHTRSAPRNPLAA